MNILKTFTGSLPRGFRGNITYRLQLPEDLSDLSIVLTYNKERISDEARYLQEYEEELLPILNSYLGSDASESQLLSWIHSMKTEIQLCLMLDGRFAGNVHMPGTKKEIRISPEDAAPGCFACPSIGTAAEIIINVFQVTEENTEYRLEVRGDFLHVETN